VPCESAQLSLLSLFLLPFTLSNRGRAFSFSAASDKFVGVNRFVISNDPTCIKIERIQGSANAQECSYMGETSTHVERLECILNGASGEWTVRIQSHLT